MEVEVAEADITSRREFSRALWPEAAHSLELGQKWDMVHKMVCTSIGDRSAESCCQAGLWDGC